MVYLNRDRYNQIDIANQQLSETLKCVGPFSTPDPRWDFGKLYEARGLARTSVSQTFTQTLPDFIFCGHQNRTGAIMGVRQSSPMAESRTRAYSSPVPSSGGSTTPVFRYTAGPGGPQIHYTGWNRPSSYHQINVTHGGRSRTDVFGNSLDQEEPDWERGEHRLMIGSLPLHLSPNLLGGFHCPVCSKFLVSDEMEIHLIMCLTKPRLAYNEDVLEKDSEECAICLDEMEQGDTIARLPCLCIYHKGCIDEWFEVNRSCPEHPSD